MSENNNDWRYGYKDGFRDGVRFRETQLPKGEEVEVSWNGKPLVKVPAEHHEALMELYCAATRYARYIKVSKNRDHASTDNLFQKIESAMAVISPGLKIE